MKIIDGKAIAAALRAELKEKIAQSSRAPGLAVVIVGDDNASQIYVRNKIKACEEVGIRSYSYALPKNANQEELESLLNALATDQQVDGILLQFPLPAGIDAKRAAACIPPRKDVDGFSTRHLGELVQGVQKIAACTPSGIMRMLEAEGVEIRGKHAVVVGRSETVGKPMAMLLLNADATVTICHSKTCNLKEICSTADILIAAIGKAKYITADMVKEGAIVIDVGMNRDENGKLCGDVDFDGVKEKASLITPVPGGVGPMTIAALLYNTYISACEE